MYNIRWQQIIPFLPSIVVIIVAICNPLLATVIAIVVSMPLGIIFDSVTIHIGYRPRTAFDGVFITSILLVINGYFLVAIGRLWHRIFRK